MKRATTILAIFLLFLSAAAQIAPDKYFVEFTDKDNSPFSIDEPLEFLSPRAVARREIAGIPIVINDLPVNPSYVEAVSLIGPQILNQVKWFNGITIYTTNPDHITAIELLPFVNKVVKNKGKQVYEQPVGDKFHIGQQIPLKVFDSAHYGLSYTQVHMVGTDELHEMGFKGAGKVIAVLDAGFLKVDMLPAFDSLWANDQILGTYDFVDPGSSVFIGHSHGMKVLSIMGGNVPGQLIGTAPCASYWLLRSEDTGSEYLVEEYNWVSAAAFADSVGADIINSSLGYTVFNDTAQSHTCADMTGNTTPVTRGANIAFSKGILVVNSAGNEGNNPNWQCVSAPSDGTDVMAIAAVDSLGQYASFSSKGIVNGSYVKPNVAAMGQLTVISKTDGTIGRGNGTSFSSPVMAGSAACLWEAFPFYSNESIKMAIEETGSQFTNPDIYLGYGIPNLFEAYERLTGVDPLQSNASLHVYPNPFSGDDVVKVKFWSAISQAVQAELFSMTGKRVSHLHHIRCNEGENIIELPALRGLRQGLYILKLTFTEQSGEYSTVLIQRIER
ncbi:MAG: S8 family serine peptidase [Bacteroidales bacterium]|nr:S8 family serine peptidase [Bacteroidota bacterium]MBL6950549.1 S8 family serine peptidase [Bacteroidales bacterium]